MTLPHPQITPIPNNEPDATPNLWNVRYVEIDSNFTDLNGRVEATEGILENAKGSYDNLPDAISSIDRRLVEVEASVLGVDAEAIARIKRATSLDWQYRYDRINFEFFAPDYTLIDRQPVAVLGGINGDDSLDVASTAGMVADGYYVLSDATHTRLIRVKAVLSSQRLRLWDTLDRSWTATGYVALTNYRIVAANQAEAAPGSIWLSKLINVGNRVGRAVIRRTDNAAVIRLYFRAEADGEWHEATGVKRSTGTDAVPAGFADYEYQLPVADNIYLRADCSGDSTVEIQHIVAFGLQYLDIINSRIDALRNDQDGLRNEWAKHYMASRLDWFYRAERVNYEFFAPDYTLLNKPVIPLREAAVIDDDTLDVGDNSIFEIGDYYLLTDTSHGRSATSQANTLLVKIRNIHSDNIITLSERLTRRWPVGVSTVSKCSIDLTAGGHAIGNDGEQWISKPIQISQETVGGGVFIRRTDNTAAIKLYWLDLTRADPAWIESTGVLTQRGTPDNKDGVPAGFADYRYPVPAPGLCKIRIEIVDSPQWVGGILTPNTRPITIQHIVAVGLTEHDAALFQLDTKADKTTTYTKTEVDSRFSALSIPDLSGVYTKAQVDTSLGLKADKTTTYTKTEVDTSLSLKADKTTTYTKTEVDGRFSALSIPDLSGVYTKAQVDTSLGLKADKTTTYTKTEVDAAIAAAAPGSVDLSGYYTKTEVDSKLVASLVYKGLWDASASALPAASSANAGFFYSISASGNGLTVGEWVASNGHGWDILPSPTISSISGGTY